MRRLHVNACLCAPAGCADGADGGDEYLQASAAALSIGVTPAEPRTACKHTHDCLAGRGGGRGVFGLMRR